MLRQKSIYSYWGRKYYLQVQYCKYIYCYKTLQDVLHSAAERNETFEFFLERLVVNLAKSREYEVGV